MLWNEEQLDAMLSTPTAALVADMARLEGDIMLLGAGGKIGPDLALMAQTAIAQAGVCKKVIAVSRFSDPIAKKLLNDKGIETICADLMDKSALAALPDVPNIIYLAGKKFGTQGNECYTWATNAVLPSLVCARFRGANFVAFSTGNIYGMSPVYGGGSCEGDAPVPVGEYAMSSLARERIFEHATMEYGSKALILRLNYAVDLRYGVLYDLAKTMRGGDAVSLNPTCFNCVWQGYVNEVTLRALLHTRAPARHLNITGPETVSVRYASEQLAAALGQEVAFVGEEKQSALLSNAAECFQLFGYPTVGLQQLITWQAQWIASGGRALGKPTHFEEREGKF